LVAFVCTLLFTDPTFALGEEIFNAAALSVVVPEPDIPPVTLIVDGPVTVKDLLRAAEDVVTATVAPVS
jgi:hypothetical protein